MTTVTIDILNEKSAKSLAGFGVIETDRSTLEVSVTNVPLVAPPGDTTKVSCSSDVGHA